MSEGLKKLLPGLPGLETVTETERRVKRPKRYRVVMLNDDYTPMEFVAWLLQLVFHMGAAEAERKMMEVHTTGKGVCGVYPHDVARTKVYRVRDLAQKHEHPLECIMEAVEEE